LVINYYFWVINYNQLMSNIGYKIRKVREIKGLTQEYVAQKLNISQPAYSKIEFGVTKLDEEKIKRLAKIFEVDPSDLLSFDENIIFNNTNQQGGNANVNTLINQLPEKLIEQYEARIKQLEEEVAYLRGLNKK
jgi:transcriptional regulator with XRE-family HTH domain